MNLEERWIEWGAMGEGMGEKEERLHSRYKKINLILKNLKNINNNRKVHNEII